MSALAAQQCCDAIMQPCCETMTDAMPHQNAHNQTTNGFTDHHINADEGDCGDCPTVAADTPNTPLLIAYISQWDLKALPLQLPDEIIGQQLNNIGRLHDSKWVVNQQFTYLDTRRLRI